MKRFVVSVIVGEFVIVGEGFKKKDVKLEAVKKMFEELQKLFELFKEEMSYKNSGRFVRRGFRILSQKIKGEIDFFLNLVSIFGQILQRRYE